MPRKTQTAGNLALAGYDDIFQSSLTIVKSKDIEEIPLAELHPPEFAPFQVNDDEAMFRMAESIKEEGVHKPGIARPRAEGGYELLDGNRRKRACELAELATMPVIVRNLDDVRAAAIILGNLDHRERILPSEKASAYRLMMDAFYHSGVRAESQSYEIMEAKTGIKKSQLYRILRLNELVLTLLDRVDAKKLAFNPAVELSHLSQVEQSAVASAMDKYGVKPSHSQAVRLKEIKKAGSLTPEAIDKMLSEAKKPPKGEPTGSLRFRKYFPPEYSQKQIDAIIIELLKDWKVRAAQ